MNEKPLKRHVALQPLSREHHHALQLCWKIRTGFSKNIEINRIRNYVLWFFENHLLQHFRIEEHFIYPILGNEHPLIQRGLTEHREIEAYILAETDYIKNMQTLAQILEQHVRFEERILFTEIQSVASGEQFKQIQLHHAESHFIENRTDVFWEK